MVMRHIVMQQAVDVAGNTACLHSQLSVQADTVSNWALSKVCEITRLQHVSQVEAS
jgi:hypothetical protein